MIEKEVDSIRGNVKNELLMKMYIEMFVSK